MSDKFVSASELEEQRKTRQEEWEKVRKPEDPEEAPEPEVDNRTLYDRLKEQKDKKDEEYQEAHRFKNQVRGLDTEEAEFLDFVDNMKAAEHKKRAEEESRLLEEIKQKAATEHLEAHAQCSSSAIAPPARKAKVLGQNKQAALLSSAIKRKSSHDDETPTPSKQRQMDPEQVNGTLSPTKPKPPTAVVASGVRPTAMKCLGILPGLADYDHSSGESSGDSDSSSESDPDTATLPKMLHEQTGGVQESSSQPKTSRQQSHCQNSKC